MWLSGFFDGHPYWLAITLVIWAGVIGAHVILEEITPKKPLAEWGKFHSLKNNVAGGSPKNTKDSVYHVKPAYWYLLKITAAIGIIFLLAEVLSGLHSSNIWFYVVVAAVAVTACFVLYWDTIYLYHDGFNATLVLNDAGLHWNGDHPCEIAWPDLNNVLVKYHDLYLRNLVYVKSLRVSIPENVKTSTISNYQFDRSGPQVVQYIFIFGPFVDASYEDILHDIGRRFGRKFSGVNLPWD